MSQPGGGGFFRSSESTRVIGIQVHVCRLFWWELQYHKSDPIFGIVYRLQLWKAIVNPTPKKGANSQGKQIYS